MALVFNHLGIWKQVLPDTTNGATAVAICKDSNGVPLVVVDKNGDVYYADGMKDGEAAEKFFGTVS